MICQEFVEISFKSWLFSIGGDLSVSGVLRLMKCDGFTLNDTIAMKKRT